MEICFECFVFLLLVIFYTTKIVVTQCHVKKRYINNINKLIFTYKYFVFQFHFRQKTKVHGCYKRHTCSFHGVFIWIIVICAHNWMSSVFGKYLTMSLKVWHHIYVIAVIILNIFLNLISITSAFIASHFLIVWENKMDKRVQVDAILIL